MKVVLDNPQSKDIALINSNQAFNRMNHNTLINISSKLMGVPGWLLKLLN